MERFCYSDAHPACPWTRKSLVLFEGVINDAHIGVLRGSELVGLEIEVLARIFDTAAVDLTTLQYWDSHSIRKVYETFGVSSLLELIDREVTLAMRGGEPWGIEPLVREKI